jgi:hypothetical protein
VLEFCWQLHSRAARPSAARAAVAWRKEILGMRKMAEEQIWSARSLATLRGLSSKKARFPAQQRKASVVDFLEVRRLHNNYN